MQLWESEIAFTGLTLFGLNNPMPATRPTTKTNTEIETKVDETRFQPSLKSETNTFPVLPEKE